MRLIDRVGVAVVAAGMAVAGWGTMAHAATYYVDFDGGADTATGLTPETAFKHAPGDTAATGADKRVALAPGDIVMFKGGVAYRGTVTVKESGAEGKPITFDGNTAGTFGKGQAIIDGADDLPWEKCASADDAKGNPKWADIFYADVPTPTGGWRRTNLCEDRKPLAVAQDPKPADPIFQESIESYHQVKGKMKLECAASVTPEKGTKENSERPLILLIAGDKNSAIVEPAVGGGFSVNLPEAVTVSSVGLLPQPKYAAPKDVVFYCDDKEIAKVELKKGENAIQKFPLAAPATFRKLTVKLLSVHEGEKGDFTAIGQVAAWTADGKEVLAHPAHMTLTDPAVFTQASPDYYKGMMLGFHGGANALLYLKVEGYDPAAHRVELEFYGGKQYADTQYSLFNSVKLIATPGEYSIEPLDDPKMSRIYLLPEQAEGTMPAGVGYSRRSAGFDIEKASDIVVQGFFVRRQGFGTLAAGVLAEGPAKNLTVKDCEVSLVRGNDGIGITHVDNILVQHCFVHENPGHTSGMVLHTCVNATVRDCIIQKNTSTGLDYYTCTDGKVIGNTVLDHRGMHANGLTFYVDCKNILIERNHVTRGASALTMQDGEGFTIRNNLFDSNGKSMVVSLWTSSHLKDVTIMYNDIVRSDATTDWEGGLYTNSKSLDGLVVKNNIIDGLASGGMFAKGTFSHNLYTSKGPDQKDGLLGAAALYEPDIAKIFVDPATDNFQLRKGSPAIGAGVTAEGDGTNKPAGQPIDLGPYQVPPAEKPWSAGKP